MGCLDAETVSGVGLIPGEFRDNVLLVRRWWIGLWFRGGAELGEASNSAVFQSDSAHVACESFCLTFSLATNQWPAGHSDFLYLLVSWLAVITSSSRLQVIGKERIWRGKGKVEILCVQGAGVQAWASIKILSQCWIFYPCIHSGELGTTAQCISLCLTDLVLENAWLMLWQQTTSHLVGWIKVTMMHKSITSASEAESVASSQTCRFQNCLTCHQSGFWSFHSTLLKMLFSLSFTTPSSPGTP